MDPLTMISTRETPQHQQADPRQVPNTGGGYGFPVDDLTRLRRFLVLGTTGGTFYAGEHDHTKQATDHVLDLIARHGERVVDAVVEVSTDGRALRQNPTLFTLAACLGADDPATRRYAATRVTDVARTGTHLALLVRYATQFRGWGPVLRRAVGDWYTRPVEEVGFQVAKYRTREGYTHRDLLRLAHPPGSSDPAHNALRDWIVGKPTEGPLPTPVRAFMAAQAATTPEGWVEVINTHRGRGFAREMLPTRALTHREVWEALVDQGLPVGALIRQLSTLTRRDVLTPMGDRTTRVAEQITDPDRLRRARVHPMALLVAHHTYAGGRSLDGASTWRPVTRIIDALDTGFYRAFGAVEPAGKRTMLALDVSASMSWNTVAGTPLSAREASAAFALVTAATEPRYMLVGFTGDGASSGAIGPVPISPRQRLNDAVRVVSDLPFGATDCALPMLYALEKGIDVDTFVIFTDGETNTGPIHPYQALTRYRERTGIPARLVAVSTTAARTTITDPQDPGSLDITGFDPDTPTVINQFSAGLI